MDTNTRNISGATVLGTANDDTIKVTGNNNIIDGLGGNDEITLTGRTGRIEGDDGDDTLNGIGNGLKLYGENGADQLTVTDVIPTTSSASFTANALLDGGAHNDVLKSTID